MTIITGFSGEWEFHGSETKAKPSMGIGTGMRSKLHGNGSSFFSHGN